MSPTEPIRYPDGTTLRQLTTWKEFKDFVDRRLADEGASQDIDIEYIDVGPSTFDIDICIDKKNNDMAIH